ncbi:alpha/beta hydrolase [Maribacter sp. PR1]|uniref:Alpha/beta hydrolase n=1 Tax=Maribacter cobaltidurans TaxID=1178778 RepID=A0ABU7IYZ9_9FLAO|nr:MULTISPECIES: alpha/beta hydrolase [Maribacter]MDC6390620.1 alpha/beta hydrolase [Maribacter sp. PR1]MEE1978011.1 alpha/beta hydrolase [Maribacter cobaltidurans]
MGLKEFIILVAIISSVTSYGQSRMPDKKYVEINSQKICYYDQGKGEVIVLLHGWPQTSYTWRKVIPILSKKYRIIAIDLPGTGFSAPTSKYDTKSIATIIDKVGLSLDIYSFHLVGHDVGAWVAATYGLLYENKLKTLTLIEAGIPGLVDSSLFVPKNADKIWQFYFNQINDLPEELISGNEKTYLSWFFDKKSFVKSAISKKDLNIYYKANKGKEKLKNGFNYYRAFNTSSAENIAFKKNISIPVLAIGGDHAVGYGVGKSVEEISSNLNSISISDCGHYIPEEKPEELCELILNLINTK